MDVDVNVEPDTKNVCATDTSASEWLGFVVVVRLVPLVRDGNVSIVVVLMMSSFHDGTVDWD